jgi:hypothetical protein
MKLSKSIALLVIPVTTLTLTACQDFSQGANLLVKALATPTTQQAAATNKVTPPKGWRFPTQADYKDDWVAFRDKLPVPFHVRGDFNGDQTTDDAWMLLRKDNRGWGLFVFLAQPGGPHQVIKVEENDMDLSPQSMGINLVKPGKYETACGKGYSDCGPGEPPVLKLKFDAIEYFVFESASSIVYWNEKKQQFVKIAISD